jgi:hypothetical protein
VLLTRTLLYAWGGARLGGARHSPFFVLGLSSAIRCVRNLSRSCEDATSEVVRSRVANAIAILVVEPFEGAVEREAPQAAEVFPLVAGHFAGAFNDCDPCRILRVRQVYEHPDLLQRLQTACEPCLFATRPRVGPLGCG